MTLVTCKVCGRRAHKGDGMLVTYRGNAYCQDEAACELRKEKREADVRELSADAIRDVENEWTVA